MLFKHNILNGIWMMDKSFANNYLPYITQFIQNPLAAATPRTPEDYLRIYNGSDSELHIAQLKDALQGSIAVINITGAITKHDQDCGPDGLYSKSQVLRTAYSLDNIKGIILHIESGGGQGSAMRLFAEAVSERNKPVVAFIDDIGASAAYGIASAADHIVASSDIATIGSIGTYITIADYEEYYKQQGIRLIDIYADASSDKNKDYIEALKGNTDAIKNEANQFNDYFLSLIESNRGDKLQGDRSVWGTGKTWRASEALQLGLIDEINTFQNTLKLFV